MKPVTTYLARPLAVAIAFSLCAPAVAASRTKGVYKKSSRPAAARTVRSAPTAGVQRPVGQVYLSKGRSQLITLPVPIADVFVANSAVADVKVQSPTQLYLFGKGEGETSFYATAANGRVVYSTNVRVSPNVNSADEVLRTAFPDADVSVVMSGQYAVLTGTVQSPDDAAQAAMLIRSLLNPGIDVNDPKTMLTVGVINRLGVATPMQVALQVRIAEVSRSVGKEIGNSFRFGTAGNNGGFFDLFRGSDPDTVPGSDGIRIGSSNFLGGTLLGALDLAETQGLATTLASPTLTTTSGQEAEFLAGGEIPITVSTVSNGTGLENVIFKTYGIKVKFLPIVKSDGRISMQVEPEVSSIDSSVKVGTIPGFLVRRVQTTVELGSGQSFMIGGLLRSDGSNNVKRTPLLGNIPVLGSLFRSTSFTRGETELMVVVTPYLVKPVSANQITLPTDGYNIPSDAQTFLLGKSYGENGGARPKPTMAPPRTVNGLPTNTAPTPSNGQVAAPGFSN
jgi:pilus assembly protein CpaC